MKFINQDKSTSKDESSYHILIALINLCIEKYVKDEATMSALDKKISSIMYLFYKEDVFTEEFIKKMFISKGLSFKNRINQVKYEAVFAEKAKEFLNWIQTAEYES